MLFTGELLKQASRYLQDGVHPRVLSEGFDLAKQRVVDFLEGFKVSTDIDRETLASVARTSLRTKLTPEVGGQKRRGASGIAPLGHALGVKRVLSCVSPPTTARSWPTTSPTL